MLCKHTPVGIKAASQKGYVYSRKQDFPHVHHFQGKHGALSHVVSTVYLARDLAIHLCKRSIGQPEHLIKHVRTLLRSKRAGSQILWMQATGQREPTPHWLVTVNVTIAVCSTASHQDTRLTKYSAEFCDCPGFGWDRVNFLFSSWYSAVFWI